MEVHEVGRHWVMQGDVLECLREIPDSVFHCCITSPPYWGLRDYGHAGQLGLEPTPDEYVANMVEVFREVRRVLRGDGTLWLNLGDSYNNAGSSKNGTGLDGKQRGGATGADGECGYKKRDLRHALGASGIKPKDLVGIPWRVAFALQADGWYLRQDCIWAKGVSGQRETEEQVIKACRKHGVSDDVLQNIVKDLNLYVGNPMPESVMDRCSKAHEYFFLLTKSEKYFYDSDAVREGVATSTVARLSQPNLGNQIGSDRVPGKTNGNMKAVGNTRSRNRRSVWQMSARSSLWEFCKNCETLFQGKDRKQIKKNGTSKTCPECGETESWVSHFASFSEDLIDAPLMAGSSDFGACEECGAPYKKVTQKNSRYTKRKDRGEPDGNAQVSSSGWEPPAVVSEEILATCDCAAPATPCAVLDPFSGSGTVGLWCKKNGRDSVLIDLNPDYVKVICARIQKEMLND